MKGTHARQNQRWLIAALLVVMAFIATPSLASADSGTGTAAVWTDQPSYAPGDMASISGSGFAAGDTVSVSLSDSLSGWTSQPVDETVASDGTFSGAPLPLPSTFSSSITATATDAATGDTASAPVMETMLAPTLTPTITTDEADYAPGSVVTITGSGWPAGDELSVFTNDAIGNSWSETDHVTTDANGDFTDKVTLPSMFVANYSVNVSDANGLAATTSFTDGNAASVSGTVTDSVTHAPISGATVTCNTTTGCNNTFSTTTNASGNYVFDSTTSKLTFNGNGPTTLKLNVSASGYTTGQITINNVNNGGSFSNANIALTPSCTAASVTTQPTDQSITYGANGTFTAAGGGSPAPTVQWKVSTDNGATFTNVSGATSPTLTLTKPQVSASGNKYEAVFTNTCGGTQTATSNAAKLTVARKAITVTPSSGQSKVYGTTDPALTFTNNPALEAGDGFTGALRRAAGENVGSYAINLGDLSAGNNYSLSLSATTVNFSITARPITVKANDVSRVYGDSTPDFSLALLSGSFASGEGFTDLGGTPSFDTGAPATGHQAVGSYPIVVSGLTSSNYDISYATGSDRGTLTITPRPLTVTGDDKSKTYDGTTFTAFTRSITGFASGESESVISGSVVYGGAALTAVHFGSYSITVDVSGLHATNYSFSGIPGTLSIGKRPITVTADAKSKFFGAVDPPLTYQVTSGSLVSGDTFSGALTRDPGELVGTYAITQGSLNASTDYSLTYVGANLTIAPWNAAGKGFYAPIGADTAHSVFTAAPSKAPTSKPSGMMWNTIKGGQTVPMKFNVFAGTVEKTGSDAFSNLSTAFTSSKMIACTDTADSDPVDFTTTATGSTVLRYDTTAMQWIYNWATPKVTTTTCYRTWVTFADGSTLEAFFQLSR